MILISSLKVIATSLVSREDLQKIVLQYECSETAHVLLSVYKEKRAVVSRMPIALSGGCGEVDVMLPAPKESFEAIWELTDRSGNVLIKNSSEWKTPRQWTLYVMISSHTDIGLHNSQYIQRHRSSEFIDEAARLCDETEDRAENDRYRYTMEGTWFWNNYGMDRGRNAAERIVTKYIQAGKIGACAGMAGNHIQTYGLEEMCRSAYERRRLKEQWSIQSETISMIDNNGLPWSMIGAYADAGYRNMIFSPNHWNPIRSTVWKADLSKPRYVWNTSSGGGGSRIDVRLESNLPMVFDWEGSAGQRLTVWCCSHYADGFGFFSAPSRRPFPCKDRKLILAELEEKMWQNLLLLEKKCPYDIWLTSSYWDDQAPDTYVLSQIQDWNAKWKWPEVRTLGNPDEPFRLLRERFGDRIPVLRGDITGGWYQHPLSVPELMAKKFEADRSLPNAEKWATVAALTDAHYAYPTTAFRRAWDALLCNDEHSYGTSGYKGRRVYETWIQHRDWIEQAEKTASDEERLAQRTIASHIPAKEESIVVFNPTAQERTEYVESEDGTSYAFLCIPTFGYRSVAVSSLLPKHCVRKSTDTPPVVENAYYQIRFAENGSLRSIYDKELRRELLDTDNAYRANELLYTKNNHQSFSTPAAATFEILSCDAYVRVIAKTLHKDLGSEIIQEVTLPHHEKRIDLDNRLYHVRDMINDKRYDRYLYYAFPFRVEGCRRLCHLNGTVAEYAKDVTGHGTDVYMAVNEWCCSENDDFGVALLMKDSHITEFDHIHPDKTDFGNTGESSQIFSYVANDWLQMHVPGGNYLDYRFRYSITSYTGGYAFAKIPQMAERFTNPVKTVTISAQRGDLPENSHCFMTLNPDLRFVCLKRADNGNGMIARFYGESDDVRLDSSLHAEPSTVDERPSAEIERNGFLTYRLGKDRIRIPTREPDVPVVRDGVPAPIGSVYTGLITKPRAAAGENRGHLYLLWGANTEQNLSHYKLYRSERAGFSPDEDSFVADILPEEYVVARYEDVGLKSNTRYYYRVCAVNDRGECGEMSEEFLGITREEQKEET